jgi:hypothetical protein
MDYFIQQRLDSSVATRDDAVLAVRSHADQFQPVLDWQLGYLGDGSGNNAAVYTSTEHYVKVRFTQSGSAYSEVYCVAANVPMVDGFRVKCGYTAYAPTLYQVIEPADLRVDGFSTDADVIIIPGTTTGYGLIAPHAISHLYLGTDPVYVNWRQITPLAVFPAGGMNVRIWPGLIPRTTGNVQVASQLVDLTSHVPGSGARYVLVSYDSTGAVVLTDGAINAGGFAALTNADIPATPAGNWRTCGVVTYVGQTALVETHNEIDFLDLRFPEEQSALPITASDLGQAILASQVYGG